jgi:hypothetical protein
LGVAPFREPPRVEVRRTPLPRTPVNRVRMAVMDKRSIVVWGVVAVFVALLGGYVADAMTSVASEDTKPGCHTDYYLWVVPVSAYCADHGNVTSGNNPSTHSGE